MGGYDNFVVKKEGGSWEIPKNLGYPINTNGNESSLIVNAKGKTAYFSSDRKGGFGGIDIYNFSLYEDARPEAITYLKGIIKDSETGEFISANFELYNIETGELIKTSYSNQKNGEFFILIPSDANYLINVEKENYIFYSDNFSVKNESGEKIFEKTIELQKIKTGNKVILKNIFFETNSYKLKDESKLELQKLLSFMKKYPNTKIEIEGHTDNVGEENTNQTLSENRAKSVIQFLVDNGISKERLSANGYGEKMPIADNNTEEGRAINRRTEFKIISAE
jgi:outer membrane protein OmpA-like peptidoglycan-associated protein